jgi:hypothetical protein
MDKSWEKTLSDSYDQAFGEAARRTVDCRTHTHHFGYAGDIEHHVRLADQVFETIALTIHRVWRNQQNPNVSRAVTTILLTQIAQDLKAVSYSHHQAFRTRP